jgi:hypothetical protein
MPKFRFPVDDTTEEVEDNPEFYQDDAWLDFDPDDDYEDDLVHDLEDEEDPDYED